MAVRHSVDFGLGVIAMTQVISWQQLKPQILPETIAA
jgi:hypothetical protein